jgi:bifunctional non-homologous end joining protein LigD
VLVPIERTIAYDAARAIAATLGRHLMDRHPKLVTMDPQISKRTGRIFFDAGMNARVKTLSAPYSVRGIPGAFVAMPLDWHDLAQAMPSDYTMSTVPALVAKRGDIWSDVLHEKQDIAAVLRAGL